MSSVACAMGCSQSPMFLRFHHVGPMNPIVGGHVRHTIPYLFGLSIAWFAWPFHVKPVVLILCIPPSSAKKIVSETELLFWFEVQLYFRFIRLTRIRPSLILSPWCYYLLIVILNHFRSQHVALKPGSILASTARMDGVPSAVMGLLRHLIITRGDPSKFCAGNALVGCSSDCWSLDHMADSSKSIMFDRPITSICIRCINIL